MKYIKAVYFFLMILMISNCQAGTNNKEDTTQAIEFVQEAQEYFRQAMQDENNTMLKQSYQSISKALAYDNNNRRIQQLYYIIGFMELIQFKEKKVLLSLKKLFPDLYQANLNPAPPAYMDVLLLLDTDDTTMKIKLLKNAIKENIRFPETYIMLATIYIDKEQYDLAINMLNRGLKNSELESLKFHYLLAETYQLKSYFLEDKLECAAIDTTLTKHIIKESKIVLKLNPNSYKMHYSLALAYEKIGQATLAIEAMRKFLKQNKTHENQVRYEGFLLQGGAKKEFFKRIKEKKDSGNLHKLAIAYFYDQNWKKTFQTLKIYIDKEKPKHFYTYLMYASAVSKIKGEEAGKIILQNLPNDIQNNIWITLLREYYLNKINDETLLSKANNACKRTEAYFWMGIHNIKRDNIKAEQYFQKVLDEKVYAYTEYGASKYYLEEGIK